MYSVAGYRNPQSRLKNFDDLTLTTYPEHYKVFKEESNALPVLALLPSRSIYGF
jgi:hypothetical protein